MNYEEARRLILLHGVGVASEDPLDVQVVDGGFLGTLRPYRGLKEQSYHDLFEALLVVGQDFYNQTTIDRKLVHTMWDLCTIARRWGLDPQGMLQCNHLISADDTKRLSRWVDDLELVSLSLLNGCPPYYQIGRYAQYILDVGPGENVAFAIPYMIEALRDADYKDPTVVGEALGKLGRKAADALPALREADARHYDLIEPTDRWDAEVHQFLREAIHLIENSR